MDGATLCSWLFVCECAHVHYYCKIPTIWDISDKYANAFSQNRTFFLTCPKLAPNSSVRQHRKDFVVRNDEKSEATYQMDPTEHKDLPVQKENRAKLFPFVHMRCISNVLTM